MRERDHERLLRIKTTFLGEWLDQPDDYYHYEATPYSTLDALFHEYELRKTDGFVDFGCGKGRATIYVHNRFQVPVTGIEMNEQLYDETLVNKVNYIQEIKKESGSIHVTCCLAEDYEVKATENRFFLFNPFSVHIFMKVVENILLSVEQQRRDVDIILYYPHTKYIEYLETNTDFKLLKEVKVPGLQNINNNERFLIFRFEESNTTGSMNEHFVP